MSGGGDGGGGTVGDGGGGAGGGGDGGCNGGGAEAPKTSWVSDTSAALASSGITMATSTVLPAITRSATASVGTQEQAPECPLCLGSLKVLGFAFLVRFLRFGDTRSSFAVRHASSSAVILHCSVKRENTVRECCV